jgi:hypothetical protein
LPLETKNVYKKVVGIMSLAKCISWIPTDKLGIGLFTVL